METTTTTPTNPVPPSGGARNTFLTVICILTFLGSGWGVIKAIRTYATADYVAQIVGATMQNTEKEVNQIGNSPSFVQAIIGSVEKDMNPDLLRKLAIFQFIANLLTLGGAILMWNLMKPGFYLYIAGIAILIIAPMAMGRLVGAIGASLIGFFGVIFIVMYAVNLKYMNKKVQ